MESSWMSDSEEEDLSRPDQEFGEDEPTVVSLNSSEANPSPSFRSPLLRSVSAGEPLFRSDQPLSRSFQRPSQSMHAHLPDPSQYPDPYPSYAVSSADSSTASTRSSAYTSFGSALNDQVHVLVAEADSSSVGLGITSDSVVQLLGGDATHSQSRALVDQTRWSGVYSGGLRSRSSSASNGNALVEHPKLREQPSYDMSWQAVDERDEIGVSEDDTDDEHLLTEDEYDEEEIEEERTAAVVVAEEGRGLIVQASNTSVAQLHVQPGTTHLLIGSSTTPNAMPAFITNTIPQICHSLLALDISANFLGALPPVLALCHFLEELNIASNPLRVLPVFLADLTNLRVLIADSTGITTLPDPLADLDKLHTISVRRNKMHALPSWFCLLPALQALYVDGNPFQGPWKALVEPLLAKDPMTPAYPLSTPTFPLPSASVQSSVDTETDPDDLSDPPSSSAPNENKFVSSPEEDHTITPDTAPFLARRMPSESSSLGSQQTASTASSSIGNAVAPARIPPLPSQTQPQSDQPRPLTRNRTTPNRSFYNQSRSSQNPNSPYLPSNSPHPSTSESQYPESPGYLGDREVRKMKSAGDLRRGRSATAASSTVPELKPALTHYATSLSSSNLLSTVSVNGAPGAGPPDNIYPERPGAPKKFASLGAATTLGSLGLSPGSRASTSRSALTQSLWDNISDNGDSEDLLEPNRISFVAKDSSPPSRKQHSRMQSGQDDFEGFNGKVPVRPRNKDGKEKGSKWGFLKKMSMGKIRNESPSRPGVNPGTGVNTSSKPMLRHTATRNDNTPERGSRSPQIDMRFSTTGTLDAFTRSVVGSPSPLPKIPTMVTPLEEEDLPPALPPKISSTDALKISTALQSPSSLTSPNASSSSSLLPPSPTHRSGKRRSFLPIDAGTASMSLNIPIPDNTHFVPGITAMNGEDASESNTHSHNNSINLSPSVRDGTPSPRSNIMDREAFLKREEERARESYTRALRSVMAYLKDMNDLGLSQGGNTTTMYGMPGEARSRRPTLLVDSQSPGSREVSMALSGTTAVSSIVEAGRTISVATTDSSGSAEERRIKDDKGKRAMVMKEILVTERTYVKGLQELMDIYIKPACSNVTILSGVGSSKETIVPAPERKIVFGGLDSLFSFHKESFLPSLEAAISPLMKPSADKGDVDGQLSLTVANAVSNIFFKHAAFMKMYSTYINNFDSAVHRVKYWTSASSAGSGQALSPSSSTSQLVGLGLSMSAISNPGAAAEGAASSGAPALSSSQKKRIKQYLKRCRLNPQHSQLNLEGYLLLPVQRIPRYRLLLEELRRSTPLEYDYLEDTLDRALGEISSLANNMNEGKRESESRRKLVQWQSRIRGKFPSPLVQPHRRLIMDGPLLLTRVVRKAIVTFETINAQGDASTVDVDCLAPELTPRPLLGILCNDLLVLCRDPSEGRDPASLVDLWAVLRMQTLPQPASIVHGNALRLVDNKAILYFDAPSASDALNWYRAINLHIPASKT